MQRCINILNFSKKVASSFFIDRALSIRNLILGPSRIYKNRFYSLHKCLKNFSGRGPAPYLKTSFTIEKLLQEVNKLEGKQLQLAEARFFGSNTTEDVRHHQNFSTFLTELVKKMPPEQIIKIEKNVKEMLTIEYHARV